MKKILLLIVSLPLFVYGAKNKKDIIDPIQHKLIEPAAKRAIVFYENSTRTYLDLLNVHETSITPDGKSLPSINGPTYFFNSWQIYKNNQKLKLILYTMSKLLKEGLLKDIYWIHDLHQKDDKITRDNNSKDDKIIADNNSQLIMPPEAANNNPQLITNSDTSPILQLESSDFLSESADYFIEALKKKKANHQMKFITFTYLLHNEKVSDEDILKFIDFMELPEDFSLSLKSFDILLENQQDIFLNEFFKNKVIYALNPIEEIMTGHFRMDLSDVVIQDVLNQKQKGEDGSINLNIKKQRSLHLRDFVSDKDNLKTFINLRNDQNKMEETLITNLSSEIASSFRADLISKMINDKKLNPKLRNYTGNNFLHHLSQNDLFLQEHWLDIKNTLTKDKRIDVNAQNKEGYTFLTFLVESGSKDILETLIAGNKKIDLFVKDIYDRSLFQISTENLKHSISSYFYKHGVKSDETNKLNSYATKTFHPMVLEPIPFFSLIFLTNKIQQGVQNQYQDNIQVANQMVDSLRNDAKNETKAFSNFETYRTLNIRREFLLDSLISKLFSAIYEGNTNKLANILKESPNIFNYKITDDLSDKNNLDNVVHYLHSTDILIEAIRFNQPASVKFILENIGDPWAKSRNFLNPLSASIITSFSLDYNDTDARKNNEKIIDMIIDRLVDQNLLEKINEKSILGFDFMELAFLSGSLHLVKKLHEEHNIALPFSQDGILETGMSYLNYALGLGYLHLAEYYKERLPKGMDLEADSGQVKCKKVFQ